MHKDKLKKLKLFLSTLILVTLIFIINVKSLSQTLIFDQIFNLTFLINDETVKLGSFEISNIIFKLKNENFSFNSYFSLLIYDLYFKEINPNSYSFLINYIWLRIPLNFIIFDLGLKQEIDLDNYSLDIFLPYSRLLIQNLFSVNTSLNRFQLSFRFFINDFTSFLFKTYFGNDLKSNLQNIYYLNFYTFLDPFQIEIIGIYYDFSQKSRLGLSIKFPFLFIWNLASCIHLDSKLNYSFFESKIQFSYNLTKFNILFFFYYTSKYFTENEFFNIISSNEDLQNLDELLVINNKIGGISFNYHPNPFIYINFDSIFNLDLFEIFSIISTRFLFSNTLKLKLSYVTIFYGKTNSTLNKYWTIYLHNFRNLFIIEIEFNIL